MTSPDVQAPAGERTVAVQGLTKRFGTVTAVRDLSFSVAPGRVTGFLGPNGAGKTTTLRMLLGLVSPSAGTASIGGRPYARLERPQHQVGALLESSSFHPGRTARDHLRVVASTVGIPDSRVDEVLAMVGLASDARRRVGGYSTGMRQRLGLAAALLADPGVLLLDEPANGLDPGGIAWMRGLLRHLAGQGRTVLVSSHVLSEVEQTVDDVIIIASGRLVQQASLAELAGGTRARVRVRTPQPDLLVAALEGEGLAARAQDDGRLVVEGAAVDRVGHLAFAAGVELHELADDTDDLERTFLRLVAGADAAAPGTGTSEATP